MKHYKAIIALGNTTRPVHYTAGDDECPFEALKLAVADLPDNPLNQLIARDSYGRLIIFRLFDTTDRFKPNCIYRYS